MIGGIPILDEWTGSLSRLLKYRDEKRALEYGFTSEILDYLELIEEISKEYPIFRDTNKEPSFRDIYIVNHKSIMKELEKRNMDPEVIGEIADIIFWRSLNLVPLSPLLRDKSNTEIYILGEESQIHVNNDRHGMIQTNLFLTHEGSTAFRRLMELIYGEGIYRSGGSIEVEITYLGDRFRVVLDHEPLTHGETTIVIRRSIQKYSTLDALHREGSISPLHYKQLVEALEQYPSILIVGEPNSGKTTLLNGIIKALPSNTRLLIIEEAREIEDLRHEGYHQVFYRHSSIINIQQRELQTLFNLRRSPDYVVFGEVITDEDIKMMLDTVLMGIRVMATIHAKNFPSLIQRLEKAYGISYKIPFYQIDLLIMMRRDLKTGRREVYRITSPRKASFRLMQSIGGAEEFFGEEI